ncbi:thioredoxin domain-containing protein [Phormidesmis sp. 146-35]
MKIQYFSALAVASFLSLGVVAGCSNPCAAKTKSPTNTSTEVQANPCASKANPCAAKAKSVETPLAQELQGKPVVVDVFATWCSACKNIAPTVAQLKKDYEGKVTFVVLDVSNQATTAEAEAKAKQLGLSEFLAVNKSQTGMIAIIDPATGKILSQQRNNPNLADYKKVLDSAPI